MRKGMQIKLTNLQSLPSHFNQIKKPSDLGSQSKFTHVNYPVHITPTKVGTKKIIITFSKYSDLIKINEIFTKLFGKF